MQIDAPTLIAYTAAFIAIVGVFFTFLLSREGRDQVLVWSILPFLMGVVGASFIINPTLQAGAPEYKVGALFILLAYGSAWQAIRVFYSRRPLPLPVTALAFSWFILAVTVFEPWKLQGISAVMRIGVIALFNGLSAYEFWRSRDDDLPSQRILLWTFAAYCAFQLLRISLVALLPRPLGLLETQTWAVIVYNLMAITLVIIFSGCMIALVRERAGLHHYRLALRDELTGVRNRRAYLENLKAMIGPAQPYALLVFDIDLFKSINDRFGHQVGDAVIIRAARAAEMALRKCDTVFRIGGEEFVCILPQVTAAEALQAAERVRSVFQTIAVSVEDKVVNATISIGVAAVTDTTCIPDAVFAAADAALYRAKQDGRNRTVVAGPVMPSSGGGTPDGAISG